MWIHLLALELIDGAGGGVVPPEPDTYVLTGGFINRARRYQQAKEEQRQYEADQLAKELATEAAQQAIQRARESSKRIDIQAELALAKAEAAQAELELSQTIYLLIEAQLIDLANQRIREIEEAERLEEARRQAELTAIMPILEEEMAVQMLLLIAIQYRS